MTQRDRENLNESQRRTQEKVQGLPVPAADPEFRARLKSQFLAGSIPATPLTEEGPDTAGKFERHWAWNGLAAAALLAAILAGVLVGFNSLPGPQLVSTNGVGQVTVNGQALPADQPDDIGDALRPGARLQVGPGGSVDILYPGNFVMRLGEGTDLRLPPRPGRWFRRTVNADLAWGEVSVRTGPRLYGGSLALTTAEARTVIHGTLVSVLRNEAVTCVCLFEGSAEVLTAGAALGEVPPGMRWVMFRDGSDPQLLEIVPDHQAHMLGLDAACATVFYQPR